jgi:hypothetical protein
MIDPSNGENIKKSYTVEDDERNAVKAEKMWKWWSKY